MMRVITGTKVIIANETLTIRRIKISNNPQGYKGVSGGIKKKIQVLLILSPVAPVYDVIVFNSASFLKLMTYKNYQKRYQRNLMTNFKLKIS